MLTGASGLLGTWLRRTAAAGTEVVSLTHRRSVGGDREVRADLRDDEAVRVAFQGTRPDLVIHAAFARDEESIVGATRHVVEGAQRSGATVVYISSEAVFSGDGRRRTEDDPPDPAWDYGRWKVEAEQIVTRSDSRSAIIRLPLISSTDPEDHVVRAIRSGAERGEPSVWFEDEVRRPALAAELAAAVWTIAGLAPAARSGVWHLAGPERLSRYELAARAVAALGLDDTVIEAASTPPDAYRPRDLELGDERARRQIGWAPSPVLT